MRISRLILTLALFLTLSPRSLAEGEASSSVLAEGTWRKVSVEATGIYCLTTSQLSSMGFSDPSRVRIYGAGGHQLGFVVAADSRDDLYLMPAVHTSAGVLFYAEGPDGYTLSRAGVYSPNLNAYSRKAYYYVTTGSATDSPTMADIPDDVDEAQPIATYDSRFLYATQSVNAGAMGRYWFSNSFSQSKTSASFSIGMPCTAGEDVELNYVAAAKSSSAGSLTMTVDKQEALSVAMPTSSASEDFFVNKSGQVTFKAPASTLSTCNVTMEVPSATGNGYLGSVIFVAKAPLAMLGSELQFRNREQRSAEGEAVEFRVSGVSSDVRIWDVTDVCNQRECQVTVSNGNAVFYGARGSVKEYVAFSPSGSFPSPTDEGSVANQNLHSHASVNYVVVTDPKFQSYAQRLCDVHSRVQGFSSRVVLVDDIYNEFGAGRPEAPAIRNYLKMLYDRGKGTADELTHVCLLGAGFYDNFDRTQIQNVIPTYQSAASNNVLTSYCTDDFYGWMNNGAGSSETYAKVLLGIGRIPCQTTSAAEAYVSKVEAYMENPVQGDWNQKAIFIGIHGDSNEHVSYSERQAQNFEENYPDMDVVRVFSEAYTRVVSATGSDYPMAVETAHNYLNNGCSLYHYTGHSSYRGTSSNYFSSDIAQALANGGKNFLLVGATCTMAPFDQVTVNQSEEAIFNANGGAIAVFAATRETYGSPNFQVTRTFVTQAYATNGTKRQTIGQANMLAKQGGPRSINTLKYVLLGDPAIFVSTPSELYVRLDSINGVAREDSTGSVMALAKNSVSCSVRDAEGNIVESFSGKATVTLYDKRADKATSGVASGTPFAYKDWGGKLYSGEVEVKDGRFSATFILSKEFDLSVGYGRLSAYAVGDDGRDAMGASEEILVGGVADTDLSDSQGPDIQVWVDYDGDTPYLHTIISDEQGINISAQGVGHEISLAIDGDRSSAISLNDYFSYEVGSSTKGSLSYPLTSHAGSRISLTLKAWDNLNNSSSVTIAADLTGSVSSDARVTYSNGNLNVKFSTDAPGGRADIDMAVYSIEGRAVAVASTVTDIRNGECDIAINGVGLRPGIYVLHCDARIAKKKITLSEKIFIKAQ